MHKLGDKKSVRTNIGTKSGFTLVEIMIVVLIIGIILNIATPSLIQARENSRSRACVATLRSIDSAKQQWMMDNKTNVFSSYTIAPGATGASAAPLYPSYLRSVPQCPSGGTYTTQNSTTLPSCSLSSFTIGGSTFTHVLS